jgi:hypothetical protein
MFRLQYQKYHLPSQKSTIITTSLLLSMLQTCSELVLVHSGLRNPDCISTMKKRVFRGVFGLCNPETSCNVPYFLCFWITKSGKIRNSIFHPITKENTIPDYEIQKPQGHFWKKHRARENLIGWEK